MVHTTTIGSLLVILLSNLPRGSAAVCAETLGQAGGGTPTNARPSGPISPLGIKEIQLASFLKTLETSFFQSYSSNISQWSRSGYPNDTVQVVKSVTAVGS